MKLNKIILLISNKEQRQVPQSEIAGILGYTRSNVSDLIKRNRDLSLEKIKILESHYNISFSEPEPEEIPDKFNLTASDWDMVSDLIVNDRELFLMMCKRIKENRASIIQFLFAK